MTGAPREDRRYCWKCRSYYPPGTRLCTRCGVDLETGEELAGPELPGAGPGLFWRLVKFVDDWTPGLLRPGVVVFSFVTALVGCAIMLFFLLVFPTVLPARLIFGAAGLVVYAHAIAFILAGRLCSLHEAVAEFTGGQWVVFFTILLLPFTALLGILNAVMGG